LHFLRRKVVGACSTRTGERVASASCTQCVWR
jgi:hypothetical protein